PTRSNNAASATFRGRLDIRLRLTGFALVSHYKRYGAVIEKRARHPAPDRLTQTRVYERSHDQQFDLLIRKEQTHRFPFVIAQLVCDHGDFRLDTIKGQIVAEFIG